MGKRLLLFYLFRCKRLRALSRIVRFALYRYRSDICLIEPETSGQLSFDELRQRAGKLLSFLQQQGVRKQEAVAFLSDNCREYFEVRTACHFGNYIFFALSASLDHDAVLYFLKEAQAKVFFYRNFSENEYLEQIPHAIDLDSPSYHAIFDKNAEAGEAKVKPSDIATYNLSSGTTRRVPKIVPLTHLSWAMSLHNYIRNARVISHRRMVFLSCVPLATAGSTTYLPLLFAGATTVIYSGAFDPARIEAYIKRYNVSRLYLTPSWLLLLFEYCKQKDERLSGLENIIVGTEPIPGQPLKEAIEFFGPKISIGYGMVEVLPPLTLLTPGDYLHHEQIDDARLESVGRVLPGVVIKIIDNQQWELPRGEIGRIAIKSKTRGEAYLNSPDAKEQFQGKWFYSGDYGSVDAKGYLSIVGRKQDILLHYDRPYFAREIEEKIYQLSFIQRCVALSRNEGIYIFASVRGNIGFSRAEELIKEFCRDNFKKHLQPADVFIKDCLPVTSLGKLDKQQLSQEVQ